MSSGKVEEADLQRDELRRAEFAVCGAAMAGAGELEEVRRGGVTSEMFSFPAARLVFSTVCELAAEKKTADEMAVMAVLAGRRFGGQSIDAVVVEMCEDFTTVAHLPGFVGTVRSAWLQRERSNAFSKMAEAERDGKPDVVAHWQKRLDEIDARVAGGVPVIIDEEEDAGEREEDGDAEPVEEVPMPGGIVGETADWIMARCEKPFGPFALVAALAVWSTLAGRKVRFQNQGTILYGMLVAATSNGKDAPLSLARSVLIQAGVTPIHFTGRLSSWNAGVEALMRVWFHPASLALVDEAAGYFGDAVRGADFGLMDFLKAAWSRGMGTLDPQGRTKKAGSLQLDSVHHPSFSKLLSAQPSTLGDAVRTSQLEDGLLPRALWVVRRQFVEEVVEENLERSRDLTATPEGQRILDRARAVWNWMPFCDADIRDMADLEARPDPKDKKAEDGEEGAAPRREVWKEPVAFGAEDDAADIFKAFTRWTQARIRPAAEGTAGPFGFLWGKATENAKRVALTLAAARCAATASESYIIRAEEARWAVRFVEATVWAGIRWAKENMADTPFQKKGNRVLGFIRAAPGGVATKSNLVRGLRHSIPTRELDEILESLIQAKTLEVVEVRTKGRSATGYRLAGRKGAGRGK